MAFWGIPLPVAAVAIIYGIATHRRWLWAIAGAYLAVSFLTFVLIGGFGGHGGGGFHIGPPSP
jgi:hypothetical protein